MVWPLSAEHDETNGNTNTEPCLMPHAGSQGLVAPHAAAHISHIPESQEAPQLRPTVQPPPPARPTPLI